jgi:hypothetical protein
MLGAQAHQEAFRVPSLFLEAKPGDFILGGPVLAFSFSLVAWCLLGLLAYAVYVVA